jgi:hypothetical protein
MQNKFWNKTNIFGLAGILAYSVTTLVLFIPFKGEPSMSIIDWRSPLGIIVIVLFVISVILYIWGIFKKEKTLSFNDKKALVEGRAQLLPKLRLCIDSRLKATRPLINKAESLSLNQYWEKYLKNTMPYIITKKKPERPLQIANSLVRHGFMFNNLYYQELKEADGNYKRTVDNYKLTISQVDSIISDKKLNSLLRGLWKYEHMHHSIQIYASLNMGNKNIPNTPLGYRGGLKGKHFSEEGFQSLLTDVNKRITYLLEANDL